MEYGIIDLYMVVLAESSGSDRERLHRNFSFRVTVAAQLLKNSVNNPEVQCTQLTCKKD